MAIPKPLIRFNASNNRSLLSMARMRNFAMAGVLGLVAIEEILAPSGQSRMARLGKLIIGAPQPGQPKRFLGF
eukprot:TRINITY_DN585_c0_g1_i1.p1 TRINITY_DN585_c0_g1~~TRINITY_DN585_c0_g1_i1.p1  ORF type:complete len:73 (+),score=24.28 TRINITY_DN585_c0_g1_i1:68-286(+)